MTLATRTPQIRKPKPRANLLATASLCALAVSPAFTIPTFAADVTYIGSNTTWSNPAAWNTNSPPTSADNALINPLPPPNTSNTLTLDTSPTIQSLTLGANTDPTLDGPTILNLNYFSLNTTNTTIQSTGILEGSGNLTLPATGQFANTGTVNANSSGGTLVLTLPIYSGNSINSGVIEATSHGTLTFGAPYTLLNPGTLSATGFGSTLITGSSQTIIGGIISTDSLGTIRSNGTSFIQSTLSGNFQFNAGFTTLSNSTLAGNISQTFYVKLIGTITNDAAWSQTTSIPISLIGDVTLLGSGSITLREGSFLANSGSIFSVGSNQTIQGEGSFAGSSATFINAGTWIANSNLAPLTLSLPGPASLATNTGIFTATAGCVIVFSNALMNLNNSNGIISATGNASRIDIAGGSITGGTLTTDPFAQIRFLGPTTLKSLTLAGNIQVNAPITLTGNITNNTFWSALSTGNLFINGNVSLNGNGTMTLHSSIIDGVNPGAILTIAKGQTITGSVFVNSSSLTLNNNGNMIASISGLPFNLRFGSDNANSFNTGNLFAINGAVLNLITAPGSTLDNSSGNISASGNASLVNFTTTSLLGGNVTSDQNSQIHNFGISNFKEVGIAANLFIDKDTLTLTNSSLAGTASIASAAKLKLTGDSPATLTSLTLAGAANAWTAALDITNNKIIIEDTQVATAHAAVLATLRNQALFGQPHLAGIYSSSSSPGSTVAVINNAIAGFTTWGGTSVDTNSVLLTLAIAGDANLDNKIDSADLNTLITHWQQPAFDWTQADFNNDGKVDINDLNLLATNWQSGVGASFESLSPQSSPLSTSSAPEPTTLTASACLAILLMRRRDTTLPSPPSYSPGFSRD